MKYGVPSIVHARSVSLCSDLEIPKSPSLRTPFLMKMFYVLMSLCRMVLLCRARRESVIYAVYIRV